MSEEKHDPHRGHIKQLHATSRGWHSYGQKLPLWWAIRDSRIVTASATKNPCGPARHEWLFRLRFAQSRVAQLDLAPTLAAFASRSVISTPPRFARDYSARAGLAVFVEMHRLRTSDAECDQGVSVSKDNLWKNVSSRPRSPRRPGRVNFVRLKAFMA
jgi:hypothetical protein